MQVALRLFTENGFGATTTRELATELGFTKAALHYHFRTKDDLLEALVRPAFDALNELLAAVPAHPSIVQRRQLLADYVDLTIASSDLVQAFATDPSMARRPMLKDGWADYQQLAQRLSGQSRPDSATRTRVRFTIGGIHASLRGLHGDADDVAVVRAAALTAAEGALGLADTKADRSRNAATRRSSTDVNRLQTKQ